MADIEHDPIELDLDWEAELVLPGAPSDEDGQEIPPGWWAFGYDPNGERLAEVPLRGIYDIHGADTGERLARRVAAFLNSFYAEG